MPTEDDETQVVLSWMATEYAAIQRVDGDWPMLVEGDYTPVRRILPWVVDNLIQEECVEAQSCEGMELWVVTDKGVEVHRLRQEGQGERDIE